MDGKKALYSNIESPIGVIGWIFYKKSSDF
jgi:hypothetical protein